MTQKNTLPTTPIDDGFRMPGEFEPHAGCWMLWPERPDVWRENGRLITYYDNDAISQEEA